MRVLIPILLLLASVVCAQETGVVAQAESPAGVRPVIEGAKELLLKARAAMGAEQFSAARRHVARVQAFHYRNGEAVAEALYLAAQMDWKTGVPESDVSAFAELKKLFPDSMWCRKAIAEFKKEATE